MPFLIIGWFRKVSKVYSLEEKKAHVGRQKIPGGAERQLKIGECQPSYQNAFAQFISKSIANILYEKEVLTYCHVQVPQEFGEKQIQF